MIQTIPDSIPPVKAHVTQVTPTPRTLESARALPRALSTYPQFVAWKYADTGKPKPSKVPINPQTLKNAGVTWPNTWATLPKATQVYLDNSCLSGIGFVLTEHDPYVMIDLDNCLTHGVPDDFSAAIVDRLETYTERSPSERGLRLFVRDESQPDALKRPQIEIYSTGRWATLTGNTLVDLPIATADLTWLYAMFPRVEDANRTTAFFSEPKAIPTDDRDLWDRIFHLDQYGHQHRQRFAGDLSGDNGDHSLAVIRLLNTLARWTNGDQMRMDRMIRQTHLDPTKFDNNRHGRSWLQGRILDAINYVNGR